MDDRTNINGFTTEVLWGGSKIRVKLEQRRDIRENIGYLLPRGSDMVKK